MVKIRRNHLGEASSFNWIYWELKMSGGIFIPSTHLICEKQQHYLYLFFFFWWKYVFVGEWGTYYYANVCCCELWLIIECPHGKGREMSLLGNFVCEEKWVQVKGIRRRRRTKWKKGLLWYLRSLDLVLDKTQTIFYTWQYSLHMSYVSIIYNKTNF